MQQQHTAFTCITRVLVGGVWFNFHWAECTGVLPKLKFSWNANCQMAIEKLAIGAQGQCLVCLLDDPSLFIVLKLQHSEVVLKYIVVCYFVVC